MSKATLCPSCGATGLTRNGGSRFRCGKCGKTYPLKSSVAVPVLSNNEIEDSSSGTERTITTKSANIQTLAQLLEYSKVDLSVWQVEKHVVNSWEVTMGGDSPKTYTNFQVKAWLKQKTIPYDPTVDLALFKKEAKTHAPIYSKIEYKAPTGNNLLEVSLFDHHYGKLAWGKETGGGNYDVSIARALAFDSTTHLLSSVPVNSVDRILFVIGNDFFNVNSSLNTTFSGIPQSEDDRWKKTYASGRKLWIKIIEQAMAIAPVDVLIVPGNHDAERSFHLGDSLECWFHNCPQVHIDNSPTLRKYYVWGKCLIGFTHGDKEAKGSLVNIMATERPVEWSKTMYREWHKGHLHRISEVSYQVLSEDRGVREWILPSLVEMDDWHAERGYSALRESMAMVWNKEKGKVAMHMYHPDE